MSAKTRLCAFLPLAAALAALAAFAGGASVAGGEAVSPGAGDAQPQASAIEAQRALFRPKTFPSAPVRVALAVSPGSNMPFVAGSLEGRECLFLLDTGATHTTLDLNFLRSAASDVKLTPVEMAAQSNVASMPWICDVSSLRVGDAEFGGFKAMALDLGHLFGSVGKPIAGILGMNVLGCTRTLLSLGGGVVTFGLGKEAREGFGPPARRDPSDPDTLLLTALVGDRRVGVIVDSGSSFTLLPEYSGWPASTNRFSVGAHDINAAGSLSSRLGEEGDLVLLPRASLKIRPLVTDRPLSQIGADVLRRYDLLIEERAVAFKPFASPAETTQPPAQPQPTQAKGEEQ